MREPRPPVAVRAWLGPAHGTLISLINVVYGLTAWSMPGPAAGLAAASRFLLAANVPLLVYALTLRPIWGPFDWDLFAITAFFLAALALRHASIRINSSIRLSFTGGDVA